MDPAQVSTLMTVVLLVIGGIFAVSTALLYLEYKTLRNRHPDDHITATVRTAFKLQGGPFLGVMLPFAFALGFLFGHLFWP